MKYKEDEKARGEEECEDYPVAVIFSVKTNAPLCRVTSLFLVCTMYIEDSGKNVALESYYMVCLLPMPFLLLPGLD